MKTAYYYNTSLGRIGIAQMDEYITHLFFEGEGIPQGYELGETAALNRAAEQLCEYLDGKREEFDIPLNPQGTQFQKKVWSALREIPYGQTRSYKEIAQSIGSPKACRAVGNANNRNPVAIIIPCHRVVGSDGGLTGYAYGLSMKKKLLELEGKLKSN